jgi:hypothetical protein
MSTHEKFQVFVTEDLATKGALALAQTFINSGVGARSINIDDEIITVGYVTDDIHTSNLVDVTLELPDNAAESAEEFATVLSASLEKACPDDGVLCHSLYRDDADDLHAVFLVRV